MHQNFRSYQLALELYRECKSITLSHGLRDQLIRASSSICLNLSEGSAKPTRRDRAKFYAIAFGSCREVQTIVQMEEIAGLTELSHQLGGHLYRLCRAT